MEKTFDELVDLKAITQVGAPKDLTKDELIKRGYITDVTVAPDLEIVAEVVPDESEDESVADEPEAEPEVEPVVDEGEE